MSGPFGTFVRRVRPQASRDRRSREGLWVQVVYVQRLNWGLLNAGVPFVFQVTVGFPRSAYGGDGILRLWVTQKDRKLLHYEARGIPVTPGGTLTIGPLTGGDTDVDWQSVRRITRSQRAALRLSLATGERRLSVQGPLTVLAYNEWHHAFESASLRAYSLKTRGHPDDRPAHVVEAEVPWPKLAQNIASYVFENHPVLARKSVDSLVLENLRTAAGDPGATLLEYSTGSDEQRTKLMQAVYVTMSKDFSFAHAREDSGSFEHFSQRIRLPGDLAAGGQKALRSRSSTPATCIDLVLFACALLERIGGQPVIMIVDHGHHAILGLWLKDGRRFGTHGCAIRSERCEGACWGDSVCADGEEIRTLQRNGYLLGVDVTGVAQGRSFGEALRIGQGYLTDPKCGGFVHAVDVHAARACLVNPVLPIPVDGGEPRVSIAPTRFLLPTAAVILVTVGSVVLVLSLRPNPSERTIALQPQTGLAAQTPRQMSPEIQALLTQAIRVWYEECLAGYESNPDRRHICEEEIARMAREALGRISKEKEK